MALVKTRFANHFGCRGESGTAAIEFALGSLFLLPLLLGTVDLGIAAFEWIQVNNLVEAETLYVTKNASTLYAANPFDSTVITNAVAPAKSGISLAAATPAVTAGCSCPIVGGITTLTPFGTSPNPKCPAALTCNGGTSPQGAYVQVSASHTHTPIVPVSWWTNPIFTSTALIKIN